MTVWKQVGLECDICDHLSNWSESTMEDARITAREEGWKRRPLYPGGPKGDICPDCAEAR